MVRAMDNCPKICILGHPDDGRYPLDYPALVRAAGERGVLLEVNNTSLSPACSRVNSTANVTEMLKHCRREGVPVVVGSDAHFVSAVGGHQYAQALLDELDFPEELVLNREPAAWSAYSLLTRKLSAFGYPVVQTTRRTFAWGLLFLLPVLPVLGFRPGLGTLTEPVYLLNLLYLGLGASALCFFTWGFAVGRLGAVRTSAYIYLVPVVTLVTSALVLGEPVTPLSLGGAALTVAGLALSEWEPRKEGRKGGAE